jgi:hypothetical protein
MRQQEGELALESVGVKETPEGHRGPPPGSYSFPLLHSSL